MAKVSPSAIVWVAAVLLLMLSAAIPVAQANDGPTDLSFAPTKIDNPDFEPPGLMLEKIGDMEYLQSLPRAQEDVYVTRDGGSCTNSLKPISRTLEAPDGSHRMTFEIPAAYITRERHRRTDPDGYVWLSVLLPDFRPGCLRDNLWGPELPNGHPRSGEGIFSGLKGRIMVGSLTPRSATYAPSEYFTSKYTLEIHDMLPGLIGYAPDRSKPDQAKTGANIHLYPPSGKWVDRLKMECPTKRGTNTVDGLCQLYLIVQEHVRVRVVMRGYEHEWEDVANGVEKLIGEWTH
ncbi:MAG: hypothetical protein KI792_08200 [Alphaproteobacteria bacterium]|nr:hypothetical protein [Alphaproteobacteria bacterium SS10]